MRRLPLILANCPFRGNCHSLPAGMLQLVLQEVGVFCMTSDWLRQTGTKWRLVGTAWTCDG